MKKVIILISIIALSVALSIIFDIRSLLASILNWLEGLGAIAIVIYIVLYALAVALFIPGSILTLGAGALFGLGWGYVSVIVGATIGALLAFLIGRYFMHEWISAKVSRYPRFQQIYDAIGKEGGKIIFLLRLSPLFPFNASNYLYSLTSVPFGSYCWATLFGIMPGSLMYVYLGTLINSVAAINSEQSRSPLEWVLYAVGLGATVCVTVYATRVARKAIHRRVDDA